MDIMNWKTAAKLPVFSVNPPADTRALSAANRAARMPPERNMRACGRCADMRRQVCRFFLRCSITLTLTR